MSQEHPSLTAADSVSTTGLLFEINAVLTRFRKIGTREYFAPAPSQQEQLANIHDRIYELLTTAPLFPSPSIEGEKQEWISVKERLPPSETSVLVLVQYDSTPIIAERRSFKGGPEIWWANCPEYGEINGDAFWYGGFEGGGAIVTHWMPLPNPPVTPTEE